MRTKAWWSLCMRMLDWSNYLRSLKLPNVKMATFECKSFLFLLSNLFIYSREMPRFLSQWRQFYVDVKFRKMNTPCQSCFQCLSHTHIHMHDCQRCDQFFFVDFRWPTHLSWNFSSWNDFVVVVVVSIGVWMSLFISVRFSHVQLKRVHFNVLCLIQLSSKYTWRENRMNSSSKNFFSSSQECTLVVLSVEE